VDPGELEQREGPAQLTAGDCGDGAEPQRGSRETHGLEHKRTTQARQKAHQHEAELCDTEVDEAAYPGEDERDARDRERRSDEEPGAA
jgi:hypothetical protein